MAFHGALRVAHSDSEYNLANTTQEDEAKYNKRNDIIQEWLNTEVTIPDVVWRGKKLREQKPKRDITEREYFVPNIDFNGSFVKQPRLRRGHSEASRTRSTPISILRSRCTCRPSTCMSINRVSRTNLIHMVPEKKNKHGNRCPMRIAELAVPTKRQCIETWRNKSEILPVYMIDRLKQRVMDQSPIAGIPEAIYCFQSGRRVSSKKCSFRWIPSMHNNNEIEKPIKCMNTRLLCVIFAHRVAKRLYRPSNLDLNSDLQKISNIVSGDIAKLMHKCRGLFDKDQRFQAIHTDVSNTITFWITGILEDLSYKLLEEELRVKNEIKAQEEAQIETMIEFTEQFVAIIDTIKKQENVTWKELEEEEGPVLDFIEDLVDNVMNICDPPQQYYYSESSGSGSRQDLSEKESEKQLDGSDKKEIFRSEESIKSGGENEDAATDNRENFTDSEHFRNEIINIIDGIAKESEDGRSDVLEDEMENKEIPFDLETEQIINNGNNKEGLPNADIGHKINNRNYEEVLSNADIDNKINNGNNEELLPNADMEHKINNRNNEDVLNNTDIENKINNENNEEVLPNGDIHHKINNRNNEEVLSNADIENKINNGNNEEVLPNGDIHHKINNRNNEEVLSNADIENKINNGNNEEVLPNGDIHHKINNRNNEEVLSNADIENKINNWNNEDLLPNADMDHKINNGNNEDVSPKADMEHDINNGNDEQVSAKTEIEHGVNDENIDQIEDDTRHSKENYDARDNFEETRSNVSERLEIFTDDIDDVKNSKKVKIPKTDLVNPDNLAEQTTSNTEEPVPKFYEHKPRWNSQTNKPNIMFAEPNQDLLSDADESWPSDLSEKPPYKVSEIASKSLSSLGRITEYDEKRIMSPEQDEDSMTDIVTNEAISLGNDVMEIAAALSTVKRSTASQANETLIKVSIEISTSESTSDSNIQKENAIDKTVTAPKTTKFHTEYQTESGESELKQTDSSTNLTKDEKISRQPSTTQSVDYGWKVHPKTAPSWVTASKWGQGRGEPSDDSITIQIKPTQVKEGELRKWCKNLQDAFINLETWSSWISATCQEAVFLLNQKELACPCLAQKGAVNWYKLKRKVRKDALLWTKLYQRTNTTFQGLKKKYENIEFSSTKGVSILNQTIFQKMLNFEDVCVNLHKMIVEAEYRAICTCLNNNHLNKEYLGCSAK